MQHQQDPVGTAGRWRRLAWASAATVLACAVGAGAIALIHDTMPRTQRAPAASATRPGVPIVDAGSAEAASARRAAPAAGRGAAAPEPRLDRPGAPPLRAVPSPNGRDGIAGAREDGSAAVAVAARAGAGARHEALPPEPARVAVDGLRVVPGDVAARAARDESRPAAGVGARTAPARQAPVVASAAKEAPARPTGREPARETARLETLRRAQCADSELLSRLVCNERVRLRFCGGRWNEHPDCMVAATRTDP